ncbi:MAG: PEP-CTERM sorting domain-containing protein [Akkermansiaceae bacterium]
MTRNDGSTPLTITTYDIKYREYSNVVSDVDFTLGAIRSTRSLGNNAETNVIAGGSGNALGINNPSVSNAEWETLGGDSQETGNMNHEESWIITFDHDITLDNVETESIESGANLSIFVDGNLEASITTNGNNANPFSGLVIAAGTQIEFMANGDILTDLRIESLTATIVPEPSSVALLGLGGLALIMRRRK